MMEYRFEWQSTPLEYHESNQAQLAIDLASQYGTWVGMDGGTDLVTNVCDNCMMVLVDSPQIAMRLNMQLCLLLERAVAAHPVQKVTRWERIKCWLGF